MAKQDGAGRLTWADNAHVHVARGKPGPACVIDDDPTAMVVGDVDGFGMRRACREADHGDERQNRKPHNELPVVCVAEGNDSERYRRREMLANGRCFASRGDLPSPRETGRGCPNEHWRVRTGEGLSLIHISEPTRQAEISYA